MALQHDVHENDIVSPPEKLRIQHDLELQGARLRDCVDNDSRTKI